MVLNKSIQNIIAYFFFSFSAFFIANISKYSPIYFSIFVVFFLSVFSLDKIFIKKLKYKKQLIINISILLSIILIFQMMINNDASFFDYLLYIASFLYLPLAFVFLENVNLAKLKTTIKSYYLITSLLLLFDFLNRVRFRNDYYVGVQYFYNFKNNGIMFQDSNFSGFLAMINFCFALYLSDMKIMKFSKSVFIFFFFLVIANLSRAAILASVSMIVFSWFEKKTKRIRLYLFFSFLLLVPLLVFILFNFFLDDDSFGTKLDIFTRTLDYLKYASLKELLFGNGIFSSPNFLGLSGHNYISQVIIEFGIIIFILQMIVFMLSVIFSKGKSLYIILPYLIAGLSMAPINIPYFYAMNAIIILFEVKQWNKI